MLRDPELEPGLDQLRETPGLSIDPADLDVEFVLDSTAVTPIPKN